MDAPANRAEASADERIRDLERDLAKAKDDLRSHVEALDAEIERLRGGLRAVQAHHVGINDAQGRPRTNSTTLRIVTAALAGCGHIPGDVCRRCYPSLPVCAAHPEAANRRFGPLWRCSECGSEATLLLTVGSPRHPGGDPA